MFLSVKRPRYQAMIKILKHIFIINKFCVKISFTAFLLTVIEHLPNWMITKLYIKRINERYSTFMVMEIAINYTANTKDNFNLKKRNM